jgi:hypothetical protein
MQTGRRLMVLAKTKEAAASFIRRREIVQTGYGLRPCGEGVAVTNSFGGYNVDCRN